MTIKLNWAKDCKLKDYNVLVFIFADCNAKSNDYCVKWKTCFRLTSEYMTITHERLPILVFIFCRLQSKSKDYQVQWKICLELTC